MCEVDETELEPGEGARMAFLSVLGVILADMIAHPDGAGELLEAMSRA